MIQLKETCTFEEGKETNVRLGSRRSFLKEQGVQRTIISCRRRANTDIFMWSKRWKTLVVTEVETFSLVEVESIELEGEGCRVGRPLPSSSKCEFFDLCEECDVRLEDEFDDTKGIKVGLSWRCAITGMLVGNACSALFSSALMVKFKGKCVPIEHDELFEEQKVMAG